VAERFRGFPQSAHVGIVIVPQDRSRQLPFLFLNMCCHESFDAIRITVSS